MASSGKNFDISPNFTEVIVLNDSNFEELTQMTTGSTTGSWFVKFYAPVGDWLNPFNEQWCGHCKNLAPVWEELADELNGEVNVAEVDATANNELAKLYEIEGFPTLFFFEKVGVFKLLELQGKYVAYEGERSLEAMKEFALGGYQDLTMKACPRPPTEFEKKVQVH